MARIKMHFADGFVQLALILSVLRTDLTQYLQQYSAYPEVQQVWQGQSLGLQLVDNYHDNGPLSYPAKHMDYREIMYNDLNRLAQLSSSGQQRIISAWLTTDDDADVSEPQPSTSHQSTQQSNELTREFPFAHYKPAMMMQQDYFRQQAYTQQHLLQSYVQQRNALHHQQNPYFRRQFSKDMDLIDILWNHDMDMGVGREMYDNNLRLEMEKKNELKLKESEEQAEREAEERLRQEMANFTIDLETGERIPIEPTPQQQLTQQPAPFPAQDSYPMETTPAFNTQQSLDTALDELSTLINTTDVSTGGMLLNTSDLIMDNNTESNVLLQNTSMVPTQMDMPFGGYNDQSLPTVATNGSADVWPSMPPQAYNPFSSNDLNASTNSTDVSFLRDFLDGAERLDMNLSMPSTSDLSALYQDAQSEDSAVEMGGASSSNGTWSDSHSVSSEMYSDNGADAGASGYSRSYKSDGTDTGFYDYEPYRGSNTNISHNHTYGAPPGGVPHIRKMDMKVKKEPTRGLSRDEKRCKDQKIPFSVSLIIDSPIEEFNDVLRQHQLSESQLALIRDIRRRGKNKAAAQNCRKKKINELGDLEGQLDQLKKKRDDLIKTKFGLKQKADQMKNMMDMAYNDVLRSLRDENGAPYNPSEYSLEISTDGNVVVIPSNSTTSDNKNRTSGSTGRGGAGKKRRYEQ